MLVQYADKRYARSALTVVERVATAAADVAQITGQDVKERNRCSLRKHLKTPFAV